MKFSFQGTGSLACLVAVALSLLPAAQAIALANRDRNAAPHNLGQEARPTPSQILDARAVVSDEGVLLQWYSDLSPANLGFNVYRLLDGRRVKLNRALIPGGIFRSTGNRGLAGGQSVGFLDRTGTLNTLYLIEAVAVSGELSISDVVRPAAEPGLRNQLLEKSTLRNPLVSGAGTTADSEQLYPAAESENLATGAIEDQWAIAAQGGLKVAVKQNGWYRVTQEQMLAAGFNPGADVRNLRLFRDGREVAISLSRAAGAFVSGDYIEFYGQGLDTPTTDTRIYYLVAGTQPGKRVLGELHATSESTTGAINPVPLLRLAPAARTWFSFIFDFLNGVDSNKTVPAKERVDASQARPASAKPKPPQTKRRTRRFKQRAGREFNHVATTTTQKSFSATVERKDRQVYFISLLNGDAENFFGQVISSVPISQTLSVANPELTADGPARLEVALQGVNSGVHQVNVSFNDVPLGTMTFFSLARQVQTFNVPVAVLVNGNNTIKFTSTVGGSVSLVDYTRLNYPHAFRADTNSLRMSLRPSQSVTIDGFTTPDVRLLDITDPFAVKVSTPITDPSGAGYAIQVTGISGFAKSRLLYALPRSEFQVPAGLSLNQPSTLNLASNGADLVIIAHKNLLASAAPLVTLRQSQGLTVSLIDVDDVYDEFSYGTHGPRAIRDFLSHAYSTWSTRPRYVVLLGDASLDPRNYQGVGDLDFVPTKLLDATFSETASDDWFSDFNDDGLPEIPIGRLPVRTAAEAALVISKIVSYSPLTVPQDALLVADDPTGYYFNFEQANDEVQALLPATMTVNKVNRRTDTNARNNVLDKLNSGQALVNYTGHGNVDTWTGASIFTTADAAKLHNAVSIVISQVYGGGGEAGATLKQDFVELFNRGGWPVRLGGWSVQYADAGGTSWQVTNLPDVVLPPGKYFLIQEKQGAGGTTNLPAPDALGTIDLNAAQGKVALVNSTTALSGNGCPLTSPVVDLFGYGAATCSSGNPAPALNETVAALRSGAGCTDTSNNSADFSAGAPAPRNSAVAASVCPNAAGRLALSFVVVMDCLNGYFQDPVLQGIAEALMKAPNGGSVAAFASSGSTIPDGQHAMATQLYTLLYGAQSIPLGDAIKTAKAATTDIDVRHTWIFFGDPSMRIR